jgi:peptidoglycan/LPS O-acetylase OafA/YrhL
MAPAETSTGGRVLPKHYFALDALRGVAAILVVILHETDGFAGLPNPRSGYLAVDLFFLLSGFVIASAYDKRLASGMSAWAFMKVRLIRLYPLYLLGFMIGFMRVLVQFKVGATPPPALPFAVGTLLELFMLPTPMTLHWSYDTPFFLNPPAWSLLYELIINLLFALTHRHLSRRNLVLALVIAGAGLVWVATYAGSLEVGNFWRSVIISPPRVAFPFLLGVLLHRTWPRVPSLGNAAAWLSMAVVLIVLSIDPGNGDARVVYDLAMVMLVFPVLLLLASGATLTGLTRRLASITGEMSYAVYIVHMPTFGLILAVLRRIAPDLHEQPAAGPAFVALVAGACLLADRVYDKPVRQWLTRRLK